MFVIFGIAMLLYAGVASASSMPKVYQELSQNYVKALMQGYDSGLCYDDDSDGDLGSGIIYNGSGEAALDAIAEKCEPMKLDFTPYADPVR